jgi:hypothetical protein
MNPEEIAHTSVNRFVDKAFNKYMAGQNEHGGSLVEKSESLEFFMSQVEEEIIDLWHYVQAFRLAQGEKRLAEYSYEDVKKVKEIMDKDRLDHVV